mmetsp:Transcript_110073/g.173502  ORF Transcript_110073/g.173502 Transcript_110073/m.173502 type:complete len:196 (-) Transcript_110073:2316-2903(-)
MEEARLLVIVAALSPKTREMPWRSALLARFVTLFLHFLVVLAGDVLGDTIFEALPESLPFDSEDDVDSRPWPESLADCSVGVPPICRPGSSRGPLFDKQFADFTTGRLGGSEVMTFACMQEACCVPLPEDNRRTEVGEPGDRHGGGDGILCEVGAGAMACAPGGGLAGCLKTRVELLVPGFMACFAGSTGDTTSS